MQIKVGQTAPEFSLYDSERNKVSLADFKGKNVLILFYPQAFSSTCTEELCTVRDDIARYNSSNAVVLGISVDSVFTLKRYRDEQGYNFPLLSDPELEVHKTYGAFGTKSMYGKTYEGVIRSTFAIDEKGKITLALYNVKATGHVAMLRKLLGI